LFARQLVQITRHVEAATASCAGAFCSLAIQGEKISP
jgi:hypothetical protein